MSGFHNLTTEGGGVEPPRALTPQLFSRQVPSPIGLTFQIILFVLIRMFLLGPDLITFYKIWNQPLIHTITILPVDRLNTIHHDNLEECYQVDPESKHNKLTTTAVIGIVGFVSTNPNSCTCVVPMSYCVCNNETVSDKISEKYKSAYTSNDIRLFVTSSFFSSECITPQSPEINQDTHRHHQRTVDT